MTTRDDAGSGHVIVCGVGGISTRIVEQLVGAGERVTVIDDSGRGGIAGPMRAEVEWIELLPDLPRTLDVAGIGRAQAIVCVMADDLLNLEIALLARDRNAVVRVVASLDNTAVARAVAVGNGPGAVLNIASLASPALAEAALGRHATDLEIDGIRFVAATLDIDADSTLRELFGDLTPVAVVRGRESVEVVACPGRDLAVHTGDRAIILGPEQRVRLLERPSAPRGSGHRLGPLMRARATVAGVLGEFEPGLFRALVFMFVLVAGSSVLLWQNYRKPGMSLLDGVYFSVETIATVGYGDFSFSDQPAWLRMWAIALMIGGITTVAVLMAFITDMLISRRLGNTSGKRRVRTMAGHYLVIGLGTFGLGVVRELIARGKQVVVLERDERNRHLTELAVLGVPAIFGDATLAVTLDVARATHAAGIAVVTSDDMVNIETGIALRDMFGDSWTAGPDVPVVMRVFDRSLRRTVADRFAFTNAQSTEELASPWFVGAALGLEVTATFVIAEQTFIVGTLDIDPGSALVGTAMADLVGAARVVALHRKRSGRHELPRRDARFEPDDRAYVVGTAGAVIALQQSSRASSGRTVT
ncbi:NAD-binding protein [Aldersonia sp. NBC_00410]|uniref:NAD-binding protein n=1 Tax=Aldersonia sp. NBC_00410 TaxID=2975954 RepID=UPI0022556CF5|nr:NAD-binding protein [Aldersonia sp. NBC_00410]MCX5042078.1 NAD-binding protein [Aldersonia sp. NBC_00410]